MTARVGTISHRTVRLLRKRAQEANALANALHEDSYFAACREAKHAALHLLSTAEALERRLGDPR